jgi:hypothetical protein
VLLTWTPEDSVKEYKLSSRYKLEGNKGEEAVGCLERCVFGPESAAVEIYRKDYTENVMMRSEAQQCLHKLHQDVRIHVLYCGRITQFALSRAVGSKRAAYASTGPGNSLAGRDTSKHVSACSRVTSGIQQY